MANRPSRASFARLTVGLAALAFPLIATGAAQAAIAGALPATTSTRPDVRSATLLSATSAEVCFDKTIQTGATTFDAFTLGGYRAGNGPGKTSISALVDPLNTNCVIVDWNANTIGDPQQYTVVEIAAGAVTSNATTAPNLADSVDLAGSSTHAGTTGVTTAPNLVGILAPTGTNLTTNTLTFVFDKTVGAALSAGGFFFIDGAGNECDGIAGGGVPGVIGSTTVTVSFNPTCDSVGVASRAGVFSGTVNSASDVASFNPNESAVLPNAPNGGATQHPDLVSAKLSPTNNDQVVYTFDKNVVVFDQTSFLAELADGQTIASNGAVGTGSTTVTATFNGNLSKQSEYAVLGWVDTDAVRAADNPLNYNTPGSANVGGNAGAFARGFTTGPDVFGVTLDKTTGVVTVNLDQRIGPNGVVPGDFTLLDGTGSPILAATPTPSFNSSAAPGPEALTLQYSPSSLTNVTQVQFNQGAMTTPLTAFVTSADAQNITQVVSGVNSGAILHAFKANAKRVKAHKHATKHSKRHSKRH